jgi:glycerophosphoryl diester phosphodiesterase
MPEDKATTFDWQGHRGARGLMPENTIPAFLKALEYPEVSTIELDLAVSKDQVLIVSHEPWMSHHICSHANGEAVQEKEADSLLLYEMDYQLIQSFDCGSRGNERFPGQQAMKVHKPSLEDAVNAIEAYCQKQNRLPVNYNMEIKSQPEYDGLKTPPPAEFAKLVIHAIEQLGIKERTCVQSFDLRPLQELQRMDTSITTALLIENPSRVEANLSALGYVPDIYSPYYKLLTANVVREAHEKGMKVIPWTVNDTSEMKAMISMGVDGIITDYPNRIKFVVQK